MIQFIQAVNILSLALDYGKVIMGLDRTVGWCLASQPFQVLRSRVELNRKKGDCLRPRKLCRLREKMLESRDSKHIIFCSWRYHEEKNCWKNYKHCIWENVCGIWTSCCFCVPEANVLNKQMVHVTVRKRENWEYTRILDSLLIWIAA